MLYYQEGAIKPSQPRLVQFQGHHLNQAHYKSGIISPEYLVQCHINSKRLTDLQPVLLLM